MSEFGQDGRRRLLAVVAVVVLVATAGCAGLGSPDEADDSGPEVDNSTNQTDSNETDDSTDDESTSSGLETSLGEFGNLDPADTDATAEQLLAESVDRLAAVDSYRLEQRVVNRQEQNNQQRRVRLNQTARVNRTQRRVTAEGTTQTQVRSATVQRYLLNGSLYESSERIAQQFGSEWVQTNVSDQFDLIFQQFDSAGQIEPLFSNASGTIEGQTEIDGQRVYALNVTVDTTAVAETRRNIDSVEQFTLKIWLSAESSLPLRIGEDSVVTVSTSGGTITRRTDSVLRYRYEEFQISLPPEAEGAPLTSELADQ